MPADVLDVLVKELNQIRDAGFDERVGYSDMTAERQQKFDKQSLLCDTLEQRNAELIKSQGETTKENASLLNTIDTKKIIIENKNSEIRSYEKQNNDLRKIIFVYSVCLGLGGILATILILKYCI
jgi:hypothetical protein